MRKNRESSPFRSNWVVFASCLLIASDSEIRCHESIRRRRTVHLFIGLVHLSTSALAGGGAGILKTQQEQLFCPSTALTWGHSSYQHKNSQDPFSWPLHDFTNASVSVEQQADSCSRQQSISQNIQTALHTRGFTPYRAGERAGDETEKVNE